MRTPFLGILPKPKSGAKESDSVNCQVITGAIGRKTPWAGLDLQSPICGALAIGRTDIEFLGCGIVKPLARCPQKLPLPEEVEFVPQVPLPLDPTLIPLVDALSQVLLVGERCGSGRMRLYRTGPGEELVIHIQQSLGASDIPASLSQISAGEGSVGVPVGVGIGPHIGCEKVPVTVCVPGAVRPAGLQHRLTVVKELQDGVGVKR